jgi:hypothetical protein
MEYCTCSLQLDKKSADTEECWKCHHKKGAEELQKYSILVYYKAHQGCLAFEDDAQVEL